MTTDVKNRDVLELAISIWNESQKLAAIWPIH